ncbi:MAG: polyprenyl synthetase family protein [Syntrophomonadaceae bacterium]|nr:polyprenyl synthetase family protein [Syntrophomonadaceae bacterium]
MAGERLDMDLQSILETMKWELAVIDQQVSHALQARHPVLAEPLSHLGKTRGKKLRALLVYAAAELGSYQIDHLVRAAAAVEMLHLASLVHDDILDDSEVRRGVATLNRRWDTCTALLTGDFLYARCFSVLHPLGNEVMNVLLETIVNMVEGELRQLACREKLDTGVEEYLAIIKAKTASFLSACCHIGGLVGGLKPEAVSALRAYGENLGIAFQLRDDILDYAIPGPHWNKPRGDDLRRGIMTLPLITYLREGGDNVKPHLQRLWQDSNLEPSVINHLCDDIQASGVLARCTEWVDYYLQQALSHLDSLPPAPVLRQVATSLHLEPAHVS